MNFRQNSPSFENNERGLGTSQNASLFQAGKMADPEVCSTSSNFTHPRIIFIRLGKDKTKDAIQNKVFKGVRKALKDIGNKDNASKVDKNVLVLSSLVARGLQDIAMGGEYVGLLLKDGRVCRFKCICKKFRPSTKGKNTAGSDEPIFQVQSDESYARRLQDQLDSAGNSFGDFNISGESAFGFAQQPFRFGSLGNEPDVSNDPILNFSESNLDNILPETIQETQTEDDQSKIQSKIPTISKNISSNSSVESSSSKNSASAFSSSKISSNSDTTRTTSSTKPSVASKVFSSYGALTGNQSSKSDTSLPSTNSMSRPSSESSVNQPRLSTSLSNLASLRSNAQSTSYLARRPPPSPTVVHRTILTADPIILRTSRPYFVPSHILIPSFPQVSTPLFSFDPRRNQVRYLQRSNRRQLSSSPYSRRNQESSTSRNESRNSVDQGQDDSSSDFNYPEMGEIEWLQTETVSEMMMILRIMIMVMILFVM